MQFLQNFFARRKRPKFTFADKNWRLAGDMPIAPVIDEDVIYQLNLDLGGKFFIYLQTFLRDTEHRLSIIGERISARSASAEIALNAHAVCSASACVGSMELSMLCAQLEHLARQEQTDYKAMHEIYQVMLSSYATASTILACKVMDPPALVRMSRHARA